MGTIVHFPPIDLSGVTGVLIDIDDTLYAYDHCHHVAVARCQLEWSTDLARLPHMAPEDLPSLYRASRDSVTKRLHPQGTCRSRLLAFMELFENLGATAPFVLARRYSNLYWDTFLDSMVLAPQALAFLEQTRHAGLPVVAVTDMTTDVQIQKLQRLDVVSYFHSIVTSEEVGWEKPSEIIFRRGLIKLGQPAEKVIMVGDSQDKDVVGAESLGIRAFRVKLHHEV